MKKVQHLRIIRQHVEACSNRNHRVDKIGRDRWNLSGLTKKQGYLLT